MDEGQRGDEVIREVLLDWRAWVAVPYGYVTARKIAPDGRSWPVLQITHTLPAPLIRALAAQVAAAYGVAVREAGSPDDRIGRKDRRSTLT